MLKRIIAALNHNIPMPAYWCWVTMSFTLGACAALIGGSDALIVGAASIGLILCIIWVALMVWTNGDRKE